MRDSLIPPHLVLFLADNQAEEHVWETFTLCVEVSGAHLEGRCCFTWITLEAYVDILLIALQILTWGVERWHRLVLHENWKLNKEWNAKAKGHLWWAWWQRAHWVLASHIRGLEVKTKEKEKLSTFLANMNLIKMKNLKNCWFYVIDIFLNLWSLHSS